MSTQENPNPLILPLIELLPYLAQQRGLDANIPCAACGKSLLIKDAIIEGTDAAAYVVDSFCAKYINEDGTINWIAITKAYGLIAGYHTTFKGSWI